VDGNRYGRARRLSDIFLSGRGKEPMGKYGHGRNGESHPLRVANTLLTH